MRRFIPAIAFAIVACSDITAPRVGTPIRPPSAYTAWWSQVEACSGTQGQFELVRWYESPEGALGPQVLGEWLPRHDVYLVTFVVSHQLEATVKHEMLHDLLHGDTDHLSPTWTLCGL